MVQNHTFIYPPPPKGGEEQHTANVVARQVPFRGFRGNATVV